VENEVSTLVGRDLTWDTLNMLSPEAYSASLLGFDSHNRVRRAVDRARSENRPFYIGAVGGSFTAGCCVKDGKSLMFNHFASVLEMDKALFPHGVKTLNLGQGAADLHTPLYCVDKLSLMLKAPEDPPPDLWIIEGSANWYDTGKGDYAAKVETLAMRLLYEHDFGGAAVMFVEVVQSQQWRTAEGRHLNGWARAPVLDVALHAGVPMVSFLEGAIRGLGLPRDVLMQCRQWKYDGSNCDLTHPVSLELGERLDVMRKTMYAKEGEDNHWNDYGNMLMGDLLAGAVVRLATSKALSYTQDAHPMAGDTDDAIKLLSRFTHKTISCNL